MKILLYSCTKCLFEGVENHNVTSHEINDDGVYRYKCNRGHDIIQIMDNDKFQLLFDMGAMALIDGFHKDAVLSFHASLERFYEFFIRVMIVDKNICFDEFQKTWKLVKSQSERQLGAFYYLYLNEFKETPPVLNRKYIEFRNDVIHKGKIASREDVMKYSKGLYDYMDKILKLLAIDYEESIFIDRINRRELLKQKYSEKDEVETAASISMMLNISAKNKTFDDALKELKTRVNFMYTK